MKNILCIFLLAGTLAAQAQMPATNLLSHVSADADQVLHVDLGAISSKIDLPGVINLIANQSKKNKSIGVIRQLLSAGLDYHQDLIIAQTNSNQPDSIKYTTVIIHITDSAKFVAFLRDNAKEAGGEPLHFLHPLGKQRVAVHDHDASAWTDKLAVLSFYTLPKTTSTGTPHPLAATQLKTARRCAMALAGFSTTKFVTDPHFTSAFADGGDLHIWNRDGQMAGMMSKLSKLSPQMAQIGGLSQMAGKSKKTGESISTLRFENGSISFRTLKYSSPGEIAAITRGLGQGLNSELLAIVPPRQLLGVAAVHVDMAALEDSLRRNPMFPMMDTMMQGKGVSITDIFHALKGDFMFLVCSPDKPMTADTSGKHKKPSPAMYLIVSINDKAAFEKLIPMVKVKNAMTAGADTTITDTAHKKPFPHYIIQNDLAVLGKRRQLVEFANRGTTGDPVGKLLPEQNTRTAALNMAIDFHALIEGMAGPMLNPDGSNADGKKVLDQIEKLQTLQVSVGAIRGDAVETKIELTLADQNKNSLSTILDILNSFAPKPAQGQDQ
jgi:hypothetical protein